MGQPQPVDRIADPQELHARLAALGVTVTPSTVDGRRAVLHRELLQIPGVSLSETVVRMRYED